jgi:hypothetical protein
MNLAALPAFSNNNGMLEDGRRALVVDPGDAAPVVDAPDQRSLHLAGILVTHYQKDEDDIAPHVAGCERVRAGGKPTPQSHIATQRRINPFLRCADKAVIDSALAHGAASRGAADVFAALYEWKNQLR